VQANAHELGTDPDRIGVAGGSAGACLAAATALLTRDRGEIPLAFQVLVAPMLDDRNACVWEVPTWDRATNETAWRAYLGERRSDDVPAYAAPARADDLSGLPPTYVSVGGADLFFDEAVEYARRLVHAGVPTELHVLPDAPHGFENLAPDSAVARRARRSLEAWLASALNPAGAPPAR
jgi:acetyl esterase/lipase